MLLSVVVIDVCATAGVSDGRRRRTKTLGQSVKSGMHVTVAACGKLFCFFKMHNKCVVAPRDRTVCGDRTSDVGQGFRLSG